MTKPWSGAAPWDAAGDRTDGACGATTVAAGGGRPSALDRLMVVVLVVVLAAAFAGSAGVGAPALADEEADEGDPVEITESALYASPVTEAIPDTLTSEVPPTALCVLEPSLCPEESDEVRSLVGDTLNTSLDEVPAEPVHPVPPDTIAVSFLAGNPRYQSAIRVEVPEAPADHEYQRVELVLPQTDPSYHVDSPAFREVILGTFSAIGASDPELLAEGVADALAEEDLVSTEQLLGIEVCPLTAEFVPEGAPMAYSEEELPREEPEGSDGSDDGSDELGEVAVDCLRGASGLYDEDEQLWRFDLTFAAQAWADGDLDNHGLLLSPSGAPNLAFGDPDSSTNAQVVLDITEAALLVETMDATPPPPPDSSEGSGNAGPPAGGNGTTGGGSGSAPSGGSSSGGGSSLPPSSGGGGGGSAGGAGGMDADGPPMDEGVAAAGGTQEDETQAMPASEETGIQRPWWVWLLVPAILGGAYLAHRSLLGGGMGAKEPSGALARLSAKGSPARG